LGGIKQEKKSMRYKIVIGKPMIIMLIGLTLFAIYLALNPGPNPDYEAKFVNTAPQEYWDFFFWKNAGGDVCNQYSYPKISEPNNRVLF
jgi:hypothetical protein